MKKIQSLVLIVLTISLSGCFQNNFNTEGLVGNLNVKPTKERSCLEVPFQTIIGENRTKDIQLDSIKFWVKTYDFFEGQSKKVQGNYYQRIDITGKTNQGIEYKAIIEFKDCDSLYKEPEFDSADSLIKIQYPKSRLNSILNMLESDRSVLIHYHHWKEAGKWAAISYYSEK